MNKATQIKKTLMGKVSYKTMTAVHRLRWGIFEKSKELQRKSCAGRGWGRADIQVGGVLWET